MWCRAKKYYYHIDLWTSKNLISINRVRLICLEDVSRVDQKCDALLQARVFQKTCLRLKTSYVVELIWLDKISHMHITWQIQNNILFIILQYRHSSSAINLELLHFLNYEIALESIFECAAQSLFSWRLLNVELDGMNTTDYTCNKRIQELVARNKIHQTAIFQTSQERPMF